MEFTEVVSPHVALPVLGVLICAILVFAFGFKSPAQPPSFDFEDDSRRKKSKKSKTKNQSNGHAVSPTETHDSGVNKQHLPPKQSVKQVVKQQQQQQREQSPTVKTTKQKEDKVESGKKNKKPSPPTNLSAETKAKKTVAKEGEWQTLVSRKKKGKKESAQEDSVVRQEAVDEKPVVDLNEKKKRLDDPQPIIEDETDLPSAKEMAVKKRKDRKNKKAKPDNEPWEDLEEKQTTVVQEGKKRVKQPVLEEKQPVLAVKQLVLEAKPQVREPILEVKQAVLEVKPDVKQPKADVKQPKADVKQTKADVKQPKADVKQPIPEVKELSKTDDKIEVSTTKTSLVTEESQSKKKAKSKKEKRKSSSPLELVEELKKPEPEIHKKQPETEIHKQQPEPEIHKKQPEPEIPKKSISITSNPFPKSQQVEEKEEKSPVLSVAEPEFETVRSPKKKKSKEKNKKSVETEVSPPVKDEVITDNTSSSVARDRLSPQIRYSAEPESSAKTEAGDGDMATKSVDSSKTPNLSFDELSESWTEAKPKSKKKKPRREN